MSRDFDNYDDYDDYDDDDDAYYNDDDYDAEEYYDDDAADDARGGGGGLPRSASTASSSSRASRGSRGSGGSGGGGGGGGNESKFYGRGNRRERNTSENYERDEAADLASEILPKLRDRNVKVLVEGLEMLDAYLAAGYDVAEEKRREQDKLLDAFTDRLLKHVNYKVCLTTLRLFGMMVDSLAEPLRSHFNAVIEVLTERLGHNKQSIRDHSLDIILKLMGPLTPAVVFDRLRLAYKHKSARVREHYMICFVGAVQLYGAHELSFGAFLPQVIALLSDSQPSVREAAIQVLETMYRHAGAPLLAEVKKARIPDRYRGAIDRRLADVEVVDDDDLVSLRLGNPFRRAGSRRGASGSSGSNSGRTSGRASRQNTIGRSKTPSSRRSHTPRGHRTPKGNRTPKGSRTPRGARTPRGSRTPRSGTARNGAKKRSKSKSVRSSRKTSRKSSRRPSRKSSRRSSRKSSRRSSRTSSRKSSRATSPKGSAANSRSSTLKRAATVSRLGSNGFATLKSSEVEIHLWLPEEFRQVKVKNERELAREFSTIADLIKDVNSHGWQERVQALHRIAGMVLGGAAEKYDSFLSELWGIREALETQVSELRSSVAKEACLVLAFLSRALRDDFRRLADYLLPSIIKLTPVTVQVISLSGNACVRCILRNTRVRRGVGDVLKGCQNRNGVIRMRCFEYLLIVLEGAVGPDGKVDAGHLNKHVEDIVRTIKRALSDRSDMVRETARSCFWAMHALWEDEAEDLLDELDGKAERLIEEHKNLYLQELSVRTERGRIDDEQAAAELAAERMFAASLDGMQGAKHVGYGAGVSAGTSSRPSSLRPSRRPSIAPRTMKSSKRPKTPRISRSKSAYTLGARRSGAKSTGASPMPSSRKHVPRIEEELKPSSNGDADETDPEDHASIAARAVASMQGQIPSTGTDDESEWKPGDPPPPPPPLDLPDDDEPARAKDVYRAARKRRQKGSNSGSLRRRPGNRFSSSSSVPSFLKGRRESLASGRRKRGSEDDPDTPPVVVQKSPRSTSARLEDDSGDDVSVLSEPEQEPKGETPKSTRKFDEDADLWQDEEDAGGNFLTSPGAETPMQQQATTTKSTNEDEDDIGFLEYDGDDNGFSLLDDEDLAIGSFNKSGDLVVPDADVPKTNSANLEHTASPRPKSNAPIEAFERAMNRAAGTVGLRRNSAALGQAPLFPAKSDKLEQRYEDEDDGYHSDSISEQSDIGLPQILHPGARTAAVSQILTQGRSQNPMARFKALGQLATVLEEHIAIPDVLVNLDKLIVLLQDRIIDGNPKVSQRAIVSVGLVVDRVKLKVVPHLPKLLPNVLLKLGDAKSSVRDAADEVLLVLMERFHVDLLYPVVLGVFDMPSAKLRQGALDFLLALLSLEQPERRPGDAPYFSMIHNVRALVNHLHAFVIVDEPRLAEQRYREKSATVLVLIMRKYNHNALFSSILRLGHVEWVRACVDAMTQQADDTPARLAKYVNSHRDELEPEIVMEFSKPRVLAAPKSDTPLSSRPLTPDQDIPELDMTARSAIAAALRGGAAKKQADQAERLAQEREERDRKLEEVRKQHEERQRLETEQRKREELAAAQLREEEERRRKEEERQREEERRLLREKELQREKDERARQRKLEEERLEQLKLEEERERERLHKEKETVAVSEEVDAGVDSFARRLAATGGVVPAAVAAPGMVNLCPSSDAEVDGMVKLLSHPEAGRRAEGLEQLTLLTLSSRSRPLLRLHFDGYLLPLLQLVEDDDMVIRGSALEQINELLDAVPDKFTEFTDAELLTLQLLDAMGTSPKDMHATANRALGALAKLADPAKVYGVLISSIEERKKDDSKPSGVVLHASIRMLSLLIERMEPTMLDGALDRIVAALAGCMKNPNPMVRKDVVSCFVAMFQVIGEDLMPHLDVLNIGQMKLIQIYINRARSKKTG